VSSKSSNYTIRWTPFFPAYLTIRSDGSVESVTFVRSSGVAAIDDAIRRIVQSQTPYLPFQPALARDFDVIEIRRTWHFDTAIRLY
jgi:TonB family protein